MNSLQILHDAAKDAAERLSGEAKEKFLECIDAGLALQNEQVQAEMRGDKETAEELARDVRAIYSQLAGFGARAAIEAYAEAGARGLFGALRGALLGTFPS